jgi:queuine/archaeosine tRNA-ribosyltransferase
MLRVGLGCPAQVLLEVHNTWQYLAFFAAVRASLAAGRFGDYQRWFLGRKQRWLSGSADPV